MEKSTNTVQTGSEMTGLQKFINRMKNIGPGTVTTCTKSGANSGYMMLWAMLFSTIIFKKVKLLKG